MRERERDINSSPKKILRFVYMGRCAPREDAEKQASDASETRQKTKERKKQSKQSHSSRNLIYIFFSLIQ
jgi:hypothetical protein